MLSLVRRRPQPPTSSSTPPDNNESSTVKHTAGGESLKEKIARSIPDEGKEEDNDKKGSSGSNETVIENSQSKERIPAVPNNNKRPRPSSSPSPSPLTYHFAKWIILRMVGVIYSVAFWSAWNQNLGLMGQYGLLPAQDHWKTVQSAAGVDKSPWHGFVRKPSIFWWIPLNDFSLKTLYGLGIVLSLMVVVGRLNSWVVQLLLWIFYFSVVTTAEGTTFYAYGWESQLLETGFLTIFLCALPHYSWRQCRWYPCFRESSSHGGHDEEELAPSYMILWLFRWLCFRISIGAGLIKIRGSSCWIEKTCLHHHFETQPIPSPLSFVYHFLPRWVQSRMVDIDLVVQVYTSFFVLLPTRIPYSSWGTQIGRVLVRLGGWIQTGFMIGIMGSGNFAFLNHLTIVPAFACLDDSCWSWFLGWMVPGFEPKTQPPSPPVMETEHSTTPTSIIRGQRSFLPRHVLDGLLLLYIGYLSSPVISNLLQLDGKHQIMNASFDTFRLVNTYGAFGSVGEQRYEPIIMISDDGEHWSELGFPCKPGNVMRPPCFCAPYHYRVDWNIWFIGFKPHQMYLNNREFWLYKLLEKVLDGGGGPLPAHEEGMPRPWLDLLDRGSAKVLVSEYYQHGRAPRFAKVDMYHYQMSGSLLQILYHQWIHGGTSTVWWDRQYEETLIPPVMLSNGKLRYAGGR